jgi:hypothetical protein
VSVVGFGVLCTRVLGVPVPLHRDFDEVNLRSGPVDALGGPLQGRVLWVRLVGAGGVVLVAQDVAPRAIQVPSVSVEYADATAVADVRRRALAGTLRLEVETADEPVRRYVVPLPAATGNRWTQVICVRRAARPPARSGPIAAPGSEPPTRPRAAPAAWPGGTNPGGRPGVGPRARGSRARIDSRRLPPHTRVTH